MMIAQAHRRELAPLLGKAKQHHVGKILNTHLFFERQSLPVDSILRKS